MRLNKDQRLEDVTPATIMECSQLVKANSIEGCKLKEVDVIYTRWRNLHKTPSMEAGAIGFHDRTKIKKIRVTKDNTIVNRINKTKEVRFYKYNYFIKLNSNHVSQESHPNLAEIQEERAKEFRAAAKQEKKIKEEFEKNAKKQREEEAKLKSFQYVLILIDI